MPRQSVPVTAALVCALLLSGCSLARHETDVEAQRLLGPELLDGNYNNLTLNQIVANTDVPTKQAWLGAAVLDSLQKCQAFTARLGVVHGGYDLALDVATLGLAGAAAVTVPARAANLLAALAGITAGTRTAFDTDVYQQNTAPIIIQQINKTYYPEMKAYLASFPSGNLVVAVEFARISQYHADCSLTMALAQLGNGQTSRPQLTKNDLAPNIQFTAPSGTAVALGAATASGYMTTVTPSGGAPSQAVDYSSAVLVVLLNGLSATKAN